MRSADSAVALPPVAVYPRVSRIKARVTRNAPDIAAVRRFRALDGLRGVASLLVVLLHVEWPNHLTSNRFVQNGYIAVDLFFVLSGFVIASNYLHRIENLRDVVRFLGLRFFRLYPLHIAVLGAFVVLELAKLIIQHALGVAPGGQTPFTNTSSAPALVANIFLVQGLHLIDYPTWNGPSWSISCEFFAYVVFAIAVVTRMVGGRRFFALGSMMAAGGYAALALTQGTLDLTANWAFVRCLAGFFLGMMIFRITSQRRIQSKSGIRQAGELVVTAAVILTMSLGAGFAVALVIPLFVAVITLLQSDEGPVARVLNAKPAQWLGRVSYSIYMVHDFLVVCLLIVLKRVFGLPSSMYSIRSIPIVAVDPWIGDLLVVGIVMAVLATAALTYTYIEEPGRLYGRRLFPL